MTDEQRDSGFEGWSMENVAWWRSLIKDLPKMLVLKIEVSAVLVVLILIVAWQTGWLS